MTSGDCDHRRSQKLQIYPSFFEPRGEGKGLSKDHGLRKLMARGCRGSRKIRCEHSPLRSSKPRYLEVGNNLWPHLSHNSHMAYPNPYKSTIRVAAPIYCWVSATIQPELEFWLTWRSQKPHTLAQEPQNGRFERIHISHNSSTHTPRSSCFGVRGSHSREHLGLSQHRTQQTAMDSFWCLFKPSPEWGCTTILGFWTTKPEGQAASHPCP